MKTQQAPTHRLNLPAILESGELILKVREAVIDVDRLGYLMRDAVIARDFARVRNVARRMVDASAKLAKESAAFYEAEALKAEIRRLKAQARRARMRVTP